MCGGRGGGVGDGDGTIGRESPCALCPCCPGLPSLLCCQSGPSRVSCCCCCCSGGMADESAVTGEAWPVVLGCERFLAATATCQAYKSSRHRSGECVAISHAARPISVRMPSCHLTLGAPLAVDASASGSSDLLGVGLCNSFGPRMCSGDAASARHDATRRAIAEPERQSSAAFLFWIR